MIDRWYVSINFKEDIKKYLKFIKRLMTKDSYIFVRKDYLDYNSLETEDKDEIIEDIYESFIYDVQYVETQEKKEQINHDILCELRRHNFIQGSDINRVKHMLIKEDNFKIKQIVKQIIGTNIEVFQHKEPIFNIDNNKLMYQGYNNSFKAFYSKGILEGFNEVFYWYKICDLDLFTDYLSNNLTYNFIISNDKFNLENLNYYISFVENVNYVLAIGVKNKIYEQKVINVFSEEFEENKKLILYDESIEI